MPAVASPTFEDLWRKIRLYVPGAPIFLVRTWVNDAYRSLSHKRQWGWLVTTGQLIFNAAREFNDTVTVTIGSPTVTAAPGTFLPADVGRTFRQGTYPMYLVLAVAPNGSSITLNQPYYGLSTGLVSAEILDAYATCPPNFNSFIAVVDPVNQRLIPWWVTQEELDLLDPNRMSEESVPRLLAAASYSTYPPTAGQLTYEYWPKPSATGALQYYAAVGPHGFADTDVLPGLLGQRPDILETGALARAAKWPGTVDYKNPYFNLGLAKELTAQFEVDAMQLDLRDDDMYRSSWDTIPWQNLSAWAWAYDTRLLQMTDATIGDYMGGSFGGGYFGGY